MRLKTQLVIKADIESLPPQAWGRKDIQELLARTAQAVLPGLADSVRRPSQ